MNFPIDAVDFFAKTKALVKWSFDGFSVGVRPTPGTVGRKNKTNESCHKKKTVNKVASYQPAIYSPVWSGFDWIGFKVLRPCQHP